MKRLALIIAASTLALAAVAGAAVAPKDSFTAGKAHVYLKHGKGETIRLRFTGSLRGTVTGTMIKQTSLPDTGSRYAISASGRVKPLGHVSVTGTAHGTGFIAQGHETLSLTLTNARHHKTLSATSPSVPGFTSP